eukprot:gene14258-biopygen11717
MPYRMPYRMSCRVSCREGVSERDGSPACRPLLLTRSDLGWGVDRVERLPQLLRVLREHVLARKLVDDSDDTLLVGSWISSSKIRVPVFQDRVFQVPCPKIQEPVFQQADTVLLCSKSQCYCVPSHCVTVFQVTVFQVPRPCVPSSKFQVPSSKIQVPSSNFQNL